MAIRVRADSSIAALDHEANVVGQRKMSAADCLCARRGFPFSGARCRLCACELASPSTGGSKLNACRKLLAIIGLCLWLSGPTLARADAPPAWQGVWTGTIGTLPVRVCLTRPDYGGAQWLNPDATALARRSTVRRTGDTPVRASGTLAEREGQGGCGQRRCRYSCTMTHGAARPQASSIVPA